MIIKNVLALMCCLLLFSCDQEPPNPCESIICENGECINGICDCEIGYTGPSCATKVEPSKVIIKNIKLIKAPLTRDNGTPWDNPTDEDPTGAPDVFFFLQKGVNIIYESSSIRFSDVTEINGFMRFPINDIEITDLDAFYPVAMIDYDGSLDMIELMGAVSVEFYNPDVHQFKNLIRTTGDDDVEFEFEVEYFFD